MKKNEPVIKKLPERLVAFVSFKGNYIGNSKVFKDLFNKLWRWAWQKGLINADTVFLSAYQDDPNITPPEELKLEVCMSIPEGTKVNGEIEKQILPWWKYVVANFELTGPEEYWSAWMNLVEWIEKNNYKIDMSRPSYEIYLNNPEEHPKKHHIIEICFSVSE